MDVLSVLDFFSIFKSYICLGRTANASLGLLWLSGQNPDTINIGLLAAYL